VIITARATYENYVRNAVWPKSIRVCEATAETMAKTTKEAVALGLGNRGVKIFAFPLIFLFAVVAGALFVNAFGPGLGPRQ